MFRGDYNRKSTLAEFGFRLPSCVDNRPLQIRGMGRHAAADRSYVSATPGPWELERTGGVFTEQVVRPTGLIDPVCHRAADRPRRWTTCWRNASACAGEEPALPGARYHPDQAHGRGPDRIHARGRVCKVRYIHSDVDTLERIEIIRGLRLGVFDVLVGINLLREGTRHPGMRAGGDPRRRQGRLSALRDLAGSDHRPGGAQCGGPRDPLRRSHDGLHGARHRRDGPPAREAKSVQCRQRHHAGIHQEEYRRYPGERLRARSRAGRCGSGLRRRWPSPVGRTQSGSRHRGPGRQDARGRRRSRIREAARLRDEVKRLRETELAVLDDPLARQADVEARTGQPGASTEKKTRRAKARSKGGRPGTRTYKSKDKGVKIKF